MTAGPHHESRGQTSAAGTNRARARRPGIGPRLARVLHWLVAVPLIGLGALALLAGLLRLAFGGAAGGRPGGLVLIAYGAALLWCWSALALEEERWFHVVLTAALLYAAGPLDAVSRGVPVQWRPGARGLLVAVWVVTWFWRRRRSGRPPAAAGCRFLWDTRR